MAIREPARIGLVAAGGAVGTLLRWRVGVAVRPESFSILVVNIVGAGLLGFLVGRVPVRGGRSEAVRLALGTGVLGGFTTFSAYAVEVARRLDDDPSGGFAYALAMVAVSVMAAVVGIAVGAVGAPPAPGEEGAVEAPEAGP